MRSWFELSRKRTIDITQSEKPTQSILRAVAAAGYSTAQTPPGAGWFTRILNKAKGRPNV
jgi:hypothetical protein